MMMLVYANLWFVVFVRRLQLALIFLVKHQGSCKVLVMMLLMLLSSSLEEILESFRFEEEDENDDQVLLLLIVRMLKSVTVMT